MSSRHSATMASGGGSFPRRAHTAQCSTSRNCRSRTSHHHACVAVAAHRQALNDLSIHARAKKTLRVSRRCTSSPQSVDDMRAEHDVHKRKRCLNALRHALLLHHAAAYGNEQRRVAAFHIFQRRCCRTRGLPACSRMAQVLNRIKSASSSFSSEFKAHFRAYP